MSKKSHNIIVMFKATITPYEYKKDLLNKESISTIKDICKNLNIEYINKEESINLIINKLCN